MLRPPASASLAWADRLGHFGLRVFEQVLRIVDTLVVFIAPRTRPALVVAWVRRNEESYRTGSGVRRRGRHELTYSATPVLMAAYILWRTGLSHEGSLLDVGAGQGSVLLAGRLLGAEARGVELVESQVEAVRRIVGRIGATIEVGDGEGEDLFGVTHIFCAWSAFSKQARVRLSRDWHRAAPGTRILVLTHPLEDEAFQWERTMTIALPRGFDRVHVYMRRSEERSESLSQNAEG